MQLVSIPLDPRIVELATNRIQPYVSILEILSPYMDYVMDLCVAIRNDVVDSINILDYGFPVEFLRDTDVNYLHQLAVEYANRILDVMSMYNIDKAYVYDVSRSVCVISPTEEHRV